MVHAIAMLSQWDNVRGGASKVRRDGALCSDGIPGRGSKAPILWRFADMRPQLSTQPEVPIPTAQIQATSRINEDVGGLGC